MLLSDARKSWSATVDAQFEANLTAFSGPLGTTRVSALHAESRLPTKAWDAIRDEWTKLYPNSPLPEIIAAAYRCLDPICLQNCPVAVIPPERTLVQFGASIPGRFFRIVKNRGPRARHSTRDSDDHVDKDQTSVSAEDEYRDSTYSWAFRFSPIWCTWNQTPPWDRPPFSSVAEANERLALDITPPIAPRSFDILCYEVRSAPQTLFIPTLADAVRPGKGGSHTWHQYFHPAPVGAQWGETRPPQPNLKGLPEAVHDKAVATNVVVVP